MLTSALVRTRVSRDRVIPKWVDFQRPDILAAAERFIGVFEGARGQTVGRLDEAIADAIGDSPDFLFARGLSKLLMDRSKVAVQAALSPTEIRAAVFAAAADPSIWPVRPDGGHGFSSRADVIAVAAEHLELTPEQVEAGLFADLKTAHMLTEVDLPTPVELVHRYNMALAQAILLRASAVVITLDSAKPAAARQLFRFIKFRRLMHTAKRTKDGYEITLDGPLSLFRQTNRYGVNLALFLPALCLCERWSLSADVTWGKQRRPYVFELDHTVGLRTHLESKGTWESDEERHLRMTFKALGAKTKGWKLARSTRVVDLAGRGVLVPDYILRHADGREALLELVWFWRKAAFKSRHALLRAHGPQNLIVAVATRMNADEKVSSLGQLGGEVGGDRAASGAVYPFKGVISPKKLVALAEQVAVLSKR